MAEDDTNDDVWMTVTISCQLWRGKTYGHKIGDTRYLGNGPES